MRIGPGANMLRLRVESELSFAYVLSIVDADSLASPNLLRACAERLERGAMAVQVDYAVLNPDASWRTRLMSIALASFHRLRSRARERLGVSCGLRGNGMCFSRALLREVPHAAYSMTEACPGMTNSN